MTAVTMAATTTAATAAATGFFARGSVVAGPGGGEGGQLLVQPRGTTVRTFGSRPCGGAHEDFAVVPALLAMKFVNWHEAT